MALYFRQSRIKVVQNLLNKASKICLRLLKLFKSDEILPNLVLLFASGICKSTSTAKNVVTGWRRRDDGDGSDGQAIVGNAKVVDIAQVEVKTKFQKINRWR